MQSLRDAKCGFYFETAGRQDRYGKYRRGAAASEYDPQIVRYEDFAAELDAPEGWMFGVVGYDAKNIVEPVLSTTRPSLYRAPVVSFFRPTRMCVETGKYASVESSGPVPELPTFEPLISRSEYDGAVERLMEHIRRGDVYEINYTFPFAAHAPAGFDALDYYERRAAPVPFSCLYFDGERTMICFSPERFLQKHGRRLITEPIKGTAARSHDSKLDRRIRRGLKRGAKFRAENTMIVDLSRNDLHRVCVPQSVRVERWCEIRTFSTLHHSVSTIVGEIEADKTNSQAFAAAFPPGSMTGAPKVRAMQLIDQNEAYARGWYSGAAGYVDEHGNFDFNVVIRSLLLVGDKMFFHVGGALTIDSDASAEYEECLAKAASFAKLGARAYFQIQG
ncbi:MAG: anthranilate synthase component I family protein [Bacteroidia bacterium]|nr:anthranilate synthase component I family protein [Bacteroidia bacterium]